MGGGDHCPDGEQAGAGPGRQVCCREGREVGTRYIYPNLLGKGDYVKCKHKKVLTIPPLINLCLAFFRIFLTGGRGKI